MCWMSLYRGVDAVDRAVAACRENEQSRGGHSWGIATAVDGELTIIKGVGLISEEVSAAIETADVALCHTRFATRGVITKENAHPFAVRDAAGETVAALSHNGTWYGAPRRGDRCDSYYIARLMESMYRADPDRDFDELVSEVGRITGETITVLHRDGRGFAYAGRFEITHAAEECAFRSSGGKPIPDGEVKAL